MDTLIGLLAIVAASLFTGAAAYISLVEHPARLELGDEPLLAHWKPSYARALPLQSGLAIVGGMLGLIAWYHSHDWQWLAGSLVLLANWPFTLIAIMPTNRRLKAIAPGQAGPQSRALLVRWGWLHDVRSALGATAVILFGIGTVAA